MCVHMQQISWFVWEFAAFLSRVCRCALMDGRVCSAAIREVNLISVNYNNGRIDIQCAPRYEVAVHFEELLLTGKA